MTSFSDHQNVNGSIDGLPIMRDQIDSQDAALTAIELRLNSLPARQTLTLAHALQRLAPAIRRLRSNGYSADEVAAELTGELSTLGMTVSGRTLARLLPSKSRPKASRKAA